MILSTIPFFIISGFGTHTLPMAMFVTLSSSALFVGV
jgi:hypothetical protein